MGIRVLLDTNLLVHMFTPQSRPPLRLEYCVRGQFVRNLLALKNVVLVVYEEQVDVEIRRALDSMIITGRIISDVRREIIENIRRDYEEFFKNCREAGKCIIVENRAELIVETSRLYNIARRRCSGTPADKILSRHRAIVHDLKLVVAALKTTATMVTADDELYRIYRDCIYSSRRYTINSMYYVHVRDDKGLETRFCGTPVAEVEETLQSAYHRCASDRNAIKAIREC